MHRNMSSIAAAPVWIGGRPRWALRNKRQQHCGNLFKLTIPRVALIVREHGGNLAGSGATVNSAPTAAASSQGHTGPFALRGTSFGQQWFDNALLYATF